MEKKKRYWPDSSVRTKRWRAKQGKAVLTYLDLSMVKALHEEAKRKNKATWKLVRSYVAYGFSQAQRRLKRGWGILSLVEQQYAGHARQALHVAASSAGAIFGGKWVIVVDDDIDPTNMTEVTWALCTRVNGIDDFDFIQKAPSGGLIDPLTGDYFNTHILVDACIPFGQKVS